MASKGNIQQIVKVLIGDTAVLQPGRRKTEKKARRARPKAGKKSVKKPSTKGGAPKPPKPPKSEKPPGGNLPKAPEGFLSQVFGPPKPPQPFVQPFIQPSFTSFYDRQKQEERDKLLAKVLQQIAKEESKETPTGGAPSRATSVFATPAQPAVSQPSLSRKPTTQIPRVEDVLPPLSQGVFGLPAKGFSIPPSAVSIPLSSRPSLSSSSATPMQPQVPALSLSSSALTASLITQSQAIIQRAQSIRTPVSAPNQANQPSVDVDGEGKEAEELQPQQPAVTFVQAEPVVGPYQAAQAAASNPIEDLENWAKGGDDSLPSQAAASKEDEVEAPSEEQVRQKKEKKRRKQLLQRAREIESSLMKDTQNPLPGAFTKSGKLTAKATRYFQSVTNRIIELEKPGTKLDPIVEFADFVE